MARSRVMPAAAVASSREALRSVESIQKLAHRVYDSTGGDLVTWLDSAEGEAWLVELGVAVELLFRRLSARKKRALDKAGTPAGAGDAGDAGE